ATSLACEGGIWQLGVTRGDGSQGTIRARSIVNAAGPWVSEVLHGAAKRDSTSRVRLVRGSHIVVPRVNQDDRGYLFQNADGRVMFVLPYETDFSLIGTTDIDHKGSPDAVGVEAGEIEYLCQAVSEYLQTAVSPSDVVHQFAGLRPLYDDGSSAAQEATRDYVFELDTDSGAPLLSIFGGKITTFRRLALEALERLEPHLAIHAGPWTHTAPLPGGDFPTQGRPDLTDALSARYAWLDTATVARLVRQYGTRIHRVLGGAQSVADLGTDFGHGLYQVEVDYLMASEFAVSADDILWRRSKLGLRFSQLETEELERYCAAAKATIQADVRVAS
ncbi:MAG: glycerol-3-phosphate dehydrogenase, partial [Pseudomonadota bacterium]